ncbi:DUF3558 domain-containing protein [Skermania sp. ID1734]|uniref:DUF3558 domain-containing protein n=1 Tax=Skermania sp. ID1734 TaxID=2597516 RepID=UPI001180E426|nr:DUF3558 domain-containing protein [Skermania sp. ID1734]TSD95147.1 DUF3558 domain-containing protein [Skermania sp. ID1734]
MLSACGGDSSGDTAQPAPTTARAPSPLGPFFGECGNVSDDEVKQAFAMPDLPVITRNSVGCVWEAGGPLGPSVSFSWYRGSPIGREAAGSGLIGRPPEKIEIDGHPGFRGSLGDQLCEIGVQYGDDFFHWSVTYADFPPTADACDVARHLAELTASRVK